MITISSRYFRDPTVHGNITLHPTARLEANKLSWGGEIKREEVETVPLLKKSRKKLQSIGDIDGHVKAEIDRFLEELWSSVRRT